MEPIRTSGIGGEDLGELVYAKRVSAKRTNRIIAVGIIGLLAVVGLLAEDPFESDFLIELLFLAGVALLGLPIGLYLKLVASRRVVYFHRRGLRQTGLGPEQVIAYDQVESIAYKTTRVFVNGIYSETRQRMRLRLVGGNTKSLRHTFREDPKPSKKDDTPAMELETGAMAIADVLADRMRGELAGGRVVRWTPKLNLTAAGLEVATTGERHGWDRVVVMDLREGTLFLQLPGQRKPMKIRAGEENFWPGFTVLRERLAALEQAQPPASRPQPHSSF